MMKKLFVLFCFSFCLLGGTSFAQEYNIKDDTIKISAAAFPLLSFMGEIREYTPLCSDYKIAASTTTLTIRPANSKPVKICRLIVSEGSKSNPRQHQFVLVFDKEADPAEQIHDYSTKDLIEQRIAYLAKSRETAGGGKGGDEEDEKPKKGKRKKNRGDDNEEKEKEKEQESAVAKTNPPVSDSAKNNSQNESESGEASYGPASSEEIEIKDIPQEQLSARVKQKINAFYRACENLCAKVDVEGTVKYGMKLFNNDEDVIVATTNAKTKTSRPQKIRQYFNHLAQLSYKRVEMTASEIRFVSNFHKGPDGKWHASAVIIQDFKGYKDYNILAYKDQTSKTVDIIITMTEEVKDGKTIKKFDIYLGNISVTNVPS